MACFSDCVVNDDHSNSKCVDVEDEEDVSNNIASDQGRPKPKLMASCPSCGLTLNKSQEKAQAAGGIHYLPGLPAGVKFDPSDQELIEHLEAKVVRSDANNKLHPLIDEFIQTIEGDNGICYTHPQKLPGVSKDGLVRHFFHRPSKAYTTGTRKRRKVHTEIDGCETRWHKTGKTRPIVVKGKVKGYKKILVLYTNYGRQKKPEKTNWVMHQYHLGNNEDEKDGEIVVSKVFYQTQPRQCSSSIKDSPLTGAKHESSDVSNPPTYLGFYNSSTLISFDQYATNHPGSSLVPSISVRERSFIP